MFGRMVGEGGRGFGVDRDEQASAKRFCVNNISGLRRMRQTVWETVLM